MTGGDPVLGVTSLAEVFVSVGWIVPAYIQLGVLGRLATSVRLAPETEKQRLLDEGLKSIYSPPELAAMVLERYAKLPHVSEFAAPISEAIEAAQLELFHAAVATLIPAVEGTIRKIAEARGKPIGDGTKNLVEEIDEFIRREEGRSHSRSAVDERVVMLKTFRDFLTRELLVHTSRYQGRDDLNRHGILHGVFTGYGSSANFYKLISLLDLLCFFITLNCSGFSALGPDPTPQSVQLASYYRVLGAVAAQRKVLGIGHQP